VTNEANADDRRSGRTRWLVLILMSLVIFANYYLYDCFSTLKMTIQTGLGVSSEDYGVIQSFYNAPNTFLLMALIGGIFLDRFGIRRTGFVFTLLCALGGLVQAYGVSPTFQKGGPGYAFMGSFLTDYSPEMKMMCLGRLLFGLGAETQIVTLNKILAKWFKGKELAFAFGLNLGLARLGSGLGMQLSPRIAESSYGWNAALWLAAVIMVSGLVLFLIYMLMDYRNEKRRHGSTRENGGLELDERFRLSDVISLLANRSFVLIALLCATFYAAVFPFISTNAADLLTHKYGFGIKTAADFTSIVPYGAAVFTVLFSVFVDRKGKRATLMVGGALLLTVCHLAFALTMLTPWLIIPLFGVAFSLVPAAMWPAVPLLVEERRLGTAFGLMTWVQNLLCWGTTIAVGKVIDVTNPGVTPEILKAGTGRYDYAWAMLVYVAIGAISVVLAFALKIADRGPRSHGLELPSKDAAALNAARAEGD